ncbi:MAG: hypothetical protein H0U88_06830 [Chthoniobacterales bacterium]|nr:hypothetical protein [Chthoniobacterales bacterium]
MNLGAAKLSATLLAGLSEPKRGQLSVREQFRLRPTKRSLLVTLAMAVILAFGIFLRIYPSATFKSVGYDEHGYVVFLKQIKAAGVLNYEKVVQVYVEKQYGRPDAIVPATRVGFLMPAYWCGELFRLPPFQALRLLSCISSIAMLGVCAVFAYRVGGAIPMLGLSVLVATAPLQIYLAQRALIDGYFALLAVTAVWLAWENLQRPRHWGWLGTYSGILALLVLTKENAAFVVFAISGTLLLSRFLRFGTVTPHLLVATMLGPALAVFFLAAMVGGIPEWLHFYAMFVAKSRTNYYSILAQDGPWYRYFVDFVIMSPVIVTLAIGRMFQLRKPDAAEIYLTLFLGLNFLCMANVTYGMSLRYAAYWDIPLCWLACSQVLMLGAKFGRLRAASVSVALLIAVGSIGLKQYHRFFVEGEIYDPTTATMVWAAQLEKEPPPGKR